MIPIRRRLWISMPISGLKRRRRTDRPGAWHMLFRNLRNRLFPPPPPPAPLPPDPLLRFRECPQKLLEDFDILAFDQGLLATIQNNLPIDASGAPIPWYTYPAIEYLN